MMTEDETREAARFLARRIEVVKQLLNRTRLAIEPLKAKLQATSEPDPRDIKQLELLTFQGKVLIYCMGSLADEGLKLAAQFKNLREAARRAAPVINMAEIEIPDTMPDNL